MIFQKTTLDNGLRVLTIPMVSAQSATVQVLVDAGTRDEEEHVSGLAHFLEHMVFKGTRRYPSAKAVSTAVDSVGAEINANTGKERTAYYIKAWERHLKLAFDILSGFIKDPLIDPKELKKEKGVILEEIAMYDDLPMYKAPETFEELIYEGTALGRDTLGTRQTIPSITRGDFLTYRERHYVPENMVLVVAGKVERGEVLEMAERYFGGNSKLKSQSSKVQLKNKNLGKGRDSGGINPLGKPDVRVVNKKTEQAHIVVGVRGNPLGHPDRYKEEVLGAILGGGMSSRLFTEIREKRGLAYYVKCDVDHYTDNGYIATRAGVKLDKVEEAIKVILGEYGKVKSQKSKVKSQKGELGKAKEYLKGRMALALEDTHAVSEFFGHQELFEKRVRTVEEVMAGIDEVSAEGVVEVAEKFFKNDRLNLAVVGPYEDGEKFKRMLEL